MITLDGTKNKGRLGANVILAVSMIVSPNLINCFASRRRGGIK